MVITGSGSGLGKAWSKGFLADGARVIAADVNPAGLEELEALGAVTVVCDVADEASVRSLIATAVEQTGRVDALFNNAGIGLNRPFLDVPTGEFERHVEIHLYGMIYGMRHALPVMQEQGSGRIINTISRAAEFAGPRNAAYAAAKAGMWAATRSVCHDVVEEDIRINMLIPGPTNTAIWGRDMPRMQPAEVTYPTAKLLATLPKGGAHGEVFWDEKPYPIFKSLYEEA
jgi:NAD(P)-dependent dehydrogenase (short-subunit alcohol dehydrogenase family)